MLPTTKTKPKTSLADLSVLIYGPSKIGKSTFCSNSEEAVFLATEPGLNSLETYQVPINTWEDLLAAGKELAEGKHKFKTVIIDTIDNAYLMCRDYICKKNNIVDPADMSYGKGHALVNNEFRRVLFKIASMPYGIFMISHSQDKDLKTRTGEHTKTTTTLPEKARQIVIGFVDLILFFDVEMQTDKENKKTPHRIIRTKPSVDYDAGDRTGRLPEVLPLDYKKFISFFNGNKEKK